MKGYRLTEPPAAVSAESGLSQEPPELLYVEPVAADHRAVEQQDRDIQAVAAEQLGIPVDVHDGQGRQPQGSPQGLQLGHHLVAQVTALPVNHRQLGLRGRYQCFGAAIGAGPCEEKELAIERTVAGGTSPTAVTFLPPVTVE